MVENEVSTSVLDGIGFVQYVSHMGSDLTVVNAARVSFHKESMEFVDKDEKLISYLAKHNHWTPFAHPQITLRIKAPISIRTQLFKHKQGFVENEVSRRYVTDAPEVYKPLWRTKPTQNAKQGSEGFVEDVSKWETLDNAYNESIHKAINCYNLLIDQGIAPEQARFVLPQGTYTEWWWTGSLSAYSRVCKLRSDPHAQWEVREYSNAIGRILKGLFPASWKALTAV
jgi:thymidylate synthase (FAD)